MTLAPHIVIGIDQASRSGWCLYVRGVFHSSGFCTTATQRQAVVEMVMALADQNPKAVLVVLEDHGKIPLSNNARFDSWTKRAPTRNAATIIGMGDARGRWREQFELSAVPLSHFLLVDPSTWRRAVFGKGAPGLGTEQAKQLAKDWSSALCGRRVEDDNEAEAIAIATWGMREGVLAFQAKLHEAQAKNRKGRKSAPIGATLEFGFPDEGKASGSLHRPQVGKGEP